MKKVAKILGAIPLALLLMLCIIIIITEIDSWISCGEFVGTATADIIVVLIVILSSVGLKKLIFPKGKNLALFICAVAVIDVILVFVYPCFFLGKHKYDSGVVIREPTCAVCGEVKFTCMLCEGSSYTELIPLSAHDWSDYEVVQEATGCNISGEQVRTCKACGEQESEEIKPPMEHEYGEWEFEGRNETKFRYISTCSKCGAEGFKYEDRHKVKCKLCNGTGSVKYNYGSSDLEAILSGHDPYTFGPCSSCDGTGKAYADYPWE